MDVGQKRFAGLSAGRVLIALVVVVGMGGSAWGQATEAAPDLTLEREMMSIARQMTDANEAGNRAVIWDLRDQVEQKIQPLLIDPTRETCRTWMAVGVIAVVAEHQHWASYAYEALERMKPGLVGEERNKVVGLLDKLEPLQWDVAVKSRRKFCGLVASAVNGDEHAAVEASRILLYEKGEEEWSKHARQPRPSWVISNSRTVDGLWLDAFWEWGGPQAEGKLKAASDAGSLIAKAVLRDDENLRIAANAGEPIAIYLFAIENKTQPSSAQMLQRAAMAEYPPAIESMGNDVERRAEDESGRKLSNQLITLDEMKEADEAKFLDVRKAIDWWSIADDADLERSCGNEYLKMEPAYFAKLASQRPGYAIATFNKAFSERGPFYYIDPDLPEESAIKARKWFQRAAEKGQADCMGEMGIFYELGRGGVTKDHAEARRWMRRAAEAGSSDAKQWLDEHP